MEILSLQSEQTKAIENFRKTSDLKARSFLCEYQLFIQVVALKNMDENSLTISGESIKRMKMVAEGNFSQVYFAQTSSGRTVAVKKVKKSVKDKTSYQLAKKQAVILNGLDSTSVSRLLGTHQEHNYFYLIQRYQQGQSLQSILKKKKKLPVSDCQKVFRGILTGLEYLSSKNIMHRDLKPANIMLDQKYRAVIVDFGFACKIGNDDSVCFIERIGTPFYMSPQMLNRKKYNSKSDIWSLGIIYYQMLCGSLPFFGINDGQLYKNIITNRQKLFKNQRNIPDSIKNIVKQCLTIQIQKRITWAQLFGHQKSTIKSTSPQTSSIYRQNNVVYEDDSVFQNCCTFF